VNVPTTLLGMVDAAIGGKTGVDLGGAKNILGTIRQPGAVLADLDFLASLNDRQLAEGLVEVFKMAACLDAEAFDRLEQGLDGLLERQPAALLDAIDTGVRLKLAVVEEDAHESGKRMVLNFGHTIGHALETESGFEISHGAAVAIGMDLECDLAESPARDRIAAVLRRLGFALGLPKGMEAESLWQHVTKDKKITASGAVRFAAPGRLGEAEIRELDPSKFRAALR
jgi:3-dehydroquinate synthetase